MERNEERREEQHEHDVKRRLNPAFGLQIHEKHGLIGSREMTYIDTVVDVVSNIRFRIFKIKNIRKYLVLGIGWKQCEDIDYFAAMNPTDLASANSFNSLMFASFAFQFSPNIKMFDVTGFSQGEELIYVRDDFFTNNNLNFAKKGLLKACIFEV